MNRYPGIRPFRKDERHLFFGREEDVEKLYRLIRIEQVVILYGKSGSGKSSLLNAGVYPKLEEESRYVFWEARFGAYRQDSSISPCDSVIYSIGKGSVVLSTFAQRIWQALKVKQTTEKKRFIIFFDQFEELFSYPQHQIEQFKQQLAEALYTQLPDFAELGHQVLESIKEDTLYEPFELKIVLSIRSDRMALLKQLEDYLPNLLRHGFELSALSEKQAQEALSQPASLSVHPYTKLPFNTPRFFYSEQAMNSILSKLRDEIGKVETSALQIVGKHVEDYIITPQITEEPTNESPPLSVSFEQLGNLDAVFREFYEKTIASLDEQSQMRARKLVEDVLIKDGIRLPFAEQALLTQEGISTSLLERLEKSSLLRVELDSQRRKIYEIGHDTLVGPIVEIAIERRQEEINQALRDEAARQKIERDIAVKKRIRARLIAIGAIALAIFAFGAFVYGFIQNTKLKKANKEVVHQMVRSVNEYINELKYESAIEPLDQASQLKVNNEEVGKVWMELAFYYNEINQNNEAIKALSKAAGMYGKSISIASQNSDQQIKDALTSLNKQYYEELMRKYFPYMIRIQGGVFIMGRDAQKHPEGDLVELPHHQVNVSDFELAESELTQFQYNLFVKSTGHKRQKKIDNPSWGLSGTDPVVNVSWYDACRYSNWLSKRFNLDTAYLIIGYSVEINPSAKASFQLPTEAQWEYAAKGGKEQKEYVFAGSYTLDQVGWYSDNADSKVHAVKTKKSNSLGLYDMSGNVWEWCWDWFDNYTPYYDAPIQNPSGAESGKKRAVRSGSFKGYDVECRTFARTSYPPDNVDDMLGIRIARSK